MLMGSAHLLVEVILDEIPEVEHFLIGFRQFFWPLREGGCAVFVAIEAETGIGFQPFLVGFNELFIRRSTLHISAFLFEEHLQVFHLGSHHALVVNLSQGIELLT